MRVSHCAPGRIQKELVEREKYRREMEKKCAGDRNASAYTSECYGASGMSCTCRFTTALILKQAISRQHLQLHSPRT